MGIEWILYLYGAVCLSMIVFNVVYALLLRGSKPRLERRAQKLQEAANRQLKRLQRGEPVDGRYLQDLQRKLCRIKNLMAYERALRALQSDTPWFCAYITQLQPCFLYLAFIYKKRDHIQAAFFSYFLSCHMEKKHMPIQTIQEILLDYAARDNLYCRVNALRALYAFGSPAHIVAALKLQDQGSVFLHEKILTEGLLTFTGDHARLIALLWEEMPSFSPHTQLAILNYIRFQTGDYANEMFALMQDPEKDKELRLAAIRYFGRYQYPPALEPLLAFTENSDPLQWEYATVSASALARYPGPRVIGALKKALRSSNWYVRYAAAASLEALHIDDTDLIEIVTGSDRYAREMMAYRLESRRMQKAQVTNRS